MAGEQRTFMYWGTGPDVQDFAVPYPSIENSNFETQRFVDSLRNANGELVTTEIGRPQDKQNMYWAVLDPQIWWEMNRFLVNNGMFFWCRYFDFNTGYWRTRQFYVGDITALPYMVDPETHLPKHMRECTMNVIDRGFIDE